MIFGACLILAGCGKPPTTIVYEFHNARLDRYFRTANAAEVAALKSNSASGETDTGKTFLAYPASDYPKDAVPVCRFYGSATLGPNSHFFTADAGECQKLRDLQQTTPATEKRWNYEGIAFYVGITVRSSSSAADFVCAYIPQGTMPKTVTRFYNNRAQFNDSNHRYTATPAASNQMIQQNWNYEGIAMCGNP